MLSTMEILSTMEMPSTEYTTLTYRLYKFFVAGENEVIERFAQHTEYLEDVLEYPRAQVETG